MEEIDVIKLNGEFEPFSKTKLTNSVKNAFNSVGIEPSDEFIETVINKIKLRVKSTKENTIYSEEISSFIMSTLFEYNLMSVYSSWVKFNKRF